MSRVTPSRSFRKIERLTHSWSHQPTRRPAHRKAQNWFSMRSAAVISCRRSGPRDTPKADSSGNLRPKLNLRRMELGPKTWFSPQTVHIRRFCYTPPPCNGTVHSTTELDRAIVLGYGWEQQATN